MSRGDRSPSETPPIPSSCHRKGEIVTAVIVWLLLGAIVNVAVAWVIVAFVGAISIRKDNFRELPVDVAIATWSREAPVEWQRARHIPGNAVESWATGRKDLMILADDPSSIELKAGRASLPSRSWSIGYFAAGWPLPALQYNSRLVREGRSATSECTFCLHIPRAITWIRGTRTLPLWPTWPGFAINTIFYAAILWTLFAAPRRIRRRQRTKRGLCPACAYPISESATCTECGKPVRIRSAAPAVAAPLAS
jgi:hypothetical protein